MAPLYSDFDFQVIEVQPCPAESIGDAIVAINSVKIGLFENKSSCSSYSDFTSTPIEAIAGQKLSLEIKATSCNNSVIGFAVSVFIDWNNDNDFDDLNEVILKATDRYSSSNDTLMIFKVVEVPATATGDYLTTMRIAVSTFGEPALDCGFMRWGEVEDYAIHIVPSAGIFKVSDFYPKVTTLGGAITVVGDNFHQASSTNMTVGGVAPTNIRILSNTLMEVVVPGGAATVKIVFNNGQVDQVESSRALTIDNSLPPFELGSYFHLYRATINGKDIAFTYNTEFFWPYNQIFPVYTNDLTNGILCVYGGSGVSCDTTYTYNFQPGITTINPVQGVVGDKIIICGNYLYNTSAVAFNGLDASFVVLSEDRIEVTVPYGASTGKVSLMTINGWTESEEDFIVLTSYCTPNMGEMSVDIVKVQVGEFQNTSIVNQYAYDSAKNCSNYSNLEIPVYPGQLIDAHLTIQGATNILLNRIPHIYVDWNNDFDFDDADEHYTNDEFLTTAYYSSDSGKISMKIPDYINPGVKVIMRIILATKYAPGDFSGDGCTSNGEMEQYTISVLNPDEFAVKPIITNYNPKIATVGTTIYVSGSNLEDVTSVNINGIVTPVTLVNANSVEFVIPSGSTSGFFILLDSNGLASAAEYLTITAPYSITDFSPASGRIGDEVTLNGSNFKDINWVAFNGVATQDFFVINDSEIRVKVPEGATDGSISVRGGNNVIAESATWFYFCDGVTPSAHCKLSQHIYMNSLTPLSIGKSTPLIAIATSKLPMTFESSDPEIALVDNNSTVIAVQSGNVAIIAKQSGNSQYYPATIERSLEITKTAQIITFGPLQTMTYGDGSFTLSAQSNSSYPILFQSSNTSVATISDNVVTITGAGTTTITASQPENVAYLAATPVLQTLTVNKQSQTITFDPPGSKTHGDPDFNLVASSTSGLPILFSSQSDRITISGSQVAIAKPGSVTVRAFQSGNQNFIAAEQEQTFCINPAKPIITVSQSEEGHIVLSSSSTTGNQWFFNDIPIPEANSVTYRPIDNGTYKVRVQVDNCISDPSNEEILVITRVNNNIEANLHIYPNPTHDILYINLGHALSTNLEFHIYDQSGRVVKVVKAIGERNEIDVSSLPTGQYILLILDESDIKNLIFIKK